MTINPAKTFQTLASRAAIETNPRLRRNIETLLKHQQCELAYGDVDLAGVMSTLTAAPTYHLYYATDKSGNPIADTTVEGANSVRAVYEFHLQAETFALVEFNVKHLVVDAFCIAASGTFKMGHRGAEPKKMGLTSLITLRSTSHAQSVNG